MEHPFITDLTDKTLEELQETVASLMNKLTFAYRTGNGPLIQQLHMVLESYKKQQSKKLDEVFAKQKMKNTININSNKEM
jgi:hypothetical protein